MTIEFEEEARAALTPIIDRQIEQIVTQAILSTLDGLEHSATIAAKVFEKLIAQAGENFTADFAMHLLALAADRKILRYGMTLERDDDPEEGKHPFESVLVKLDCDVGGLEIQSSTVEIGGHRYKLAGWFDL